MFPKIYDSLTKQVFTFFFVCLPARLYWFPGLGPFFLFLSMFVWAAAVGVVAGF